MAYAYLCIAIVAEVIATLSLKSSQTFTKPLPSILVVVGYVTAFYCLTIVLRSIPLGVTYAVWSGVGLCLIVLAGIFFYREIPDLPAILGMILIVTGVIVIQLFSKTFG